MRAKLSFGWESLLVGLFFSKMHRAVSFFLPFMSLRISAAGARVERTRPIPAPVVECRECRHAALTHHARSDGYTRGTLGVLIPLVVWNCTAAGCPCANFDPVVKK